MRPDVRQVLTWLASETERLLSTVDALWECDFNEQSRLPDWTTGQLVTHLARDADAAVDRLTGKPVIHDDANGGWDVDTGGDRPGAVLIGDVFDSAARLSRTLERMTDEDRRPDGTPDDPSVPVSQIPWLRLREVTIHHADLGSHLAELPLDLQSALLDDAVQAVRLRDDWPALSVKPIGDRALCPHPSEEPVAEVTGTVPDLLAWITGRSPGDGVTSSTGSLPPRPFWL